MHSSARNPEDAPRSVPAAEEWLVSAAQSWAGLKS